MLNYRKLILLLMIPWTIAIVCGAIMLYRGIVNVQAFKELGQWGDFFGGVLNPFLTFLTFTAVLITIAIQLAELNLTRQELKRSADALESQISATEKQNFEFTFFQMLTLHNTIVNSIDLKAIGSGTVTTGRDCFRTFYHRLSKKYQKATYEMPNEADEMILSVAYAQYWNENKHELGHYYRYLFNIVRFVDESNFNDGYYLKLIRSQLSDQELLLLFYNSLSEQGAKFKILIEKYALLNNLPTELLLNLNHIPRMSNTAY